MKKPVAILGVGMTKFGRITGRSNVEMALVAGTNALKDAAVSPGDVEIAFCTHCNQGVANGLRVFNALGISGIPITNLELACASESRGVFLAAELISAGAYDMAMVLGVEKMPRGMVPTGGDVSEAGYEARMGLTMMPGAYAARVNRHMYLYGTKREHLAKVAVKEHRNGSLNPNATYRDTYTLEEVLNSRMIADPLTLYMCSANADGATATILCSVDKARQYTKKPVLLVGWAAASPVYSKDEPGLSDSPVDLLGKKVYEMSGAGPKDVDVAQCHDAFSPGEIFVLEDLGFCPVGEGGPFVWEGNTEIDGKIPMNTDGGLVSCGHPIGATGGRMIAELVWQLRGQAGQRQVKNPKVAMLHNEGAGGANVMMFKA